MTPEETQHALRQYQQWLADAQLLAARLSAQLATANIVIEDLKQAPGTTPPKPSPPKTGDADA